MKEKIFVLVLLAVLVSCGGGSGGSNNDGSLGADFVTVTTDSGVPYTYTETANASSPVSYDPYIWSSGTSTISVNKYIHTYDGSQSSTPRMQITIRGTVPGTYNISDGNILYYMPAGGSIYNCTSTTAGASGTVTITEFGASGGGQIKGSFDAIAAKVPTLTPTVHLTGSFTITRN